MHGLPYEFQQVRSRVLLMKHTGSRSIFAPWMNSERLRGRNLAWFGLDELSYTAEETWLRCEKAHMRDPQQAHKQISADYGRLDAFSIWVSIGSTRDLSGTASAVMKCIGASHLEKP